MFAIIDNKKIEGKTLSEIKRKASTIANNNFRVCDEMILCVDNCNFKLYRRNSKYLNNTITRGVWR